MATPPAIGQLSPTTSYSSDSKSTDLPFVAKIGKKRRCVYWHVKPNGNYYDECLIGSAYANEAIQYIIDKDFEPLLGWILRDMSKNGHFSGIEFGFLSTVAGWAAYGAKIHTGRA